MRGIAFVGCVGLVACGGPADKAAAESDADTSAVGPVDWTRGAVPTGELGEVRGKLTRRGIVHLHSPWSHDACDGDGIIDGAPDPDCLADLRAGLCDAGIDVAWLTDHPAHAAEQPYAERLHVREGTDRWLAVDGVPEAAAVWTCEDGRGVVIRPGYEDTLMPLGMVAPLHDDRSTEDTIANDDSAESIAIMRSAGALVAVAHTEGRDDDWLARVVADGVGAVELVNLHAAFDPRIRQEDLGLDGVDWLQRIGPFTDAAAAAQPDLMVLAVLAHQPPSLARWDALTMAGHHVVATAGTDAHQNVLPTEFPDGERGDSYRRMLRWWTHHIRVSPGDADDPAALQDALAAGHFTVVAEVLGTPLGFDVWLETDAGDTVETGGTGGSGRLNVSCPTLAAGSPDGDKEPEITVTVIKDGAVWASGCGAHSTDGAGVYRVQVEVVPWHLERFLGADAADWMTAYPWIYSQAIRVE